MWRTGPTTSSSSADLGFVLCPVIVHFVQPKDKNLKSKHLVLYFLRTNLAAVHLILCFLGRRRQNRTKSSLLAVEVRAQPCFLFTQDRRLCLFFLFNLVPPPSHFLPCSPDQPVLWRRCDTRQTHISSRNQQEINCLFCFHWINRNGSFFDVLLAKLKDLLNNYLIMK